MYGGQAAITQLASGYTMSIWLESHDDLRDHAKTRKLCRLLGISRPTAIGHLHCLWWWCMHYAQDGDLSTVDREDIAYAAMWEGDPDAFIEALIGCGSGDGIGFVNADMRIHDWDQYGAKLLWKRNANRARMRRARADVQSPQPTPAPPAAPEPAADESLPSDVQRTCNAHTAHVQSTCNACATTTGQDRTGQDRTGQDKGLGGAKAPLAPAGAQPPPPAPAVRLSRPKQPPARNLTRDPPSVTEVEAELARSDTRCRLVGTGWAEDTFIAKNAAAGWRLSSGRGGMVRDLGAHIRCWADRELQFQRERIEAKVAEHGGYETAEERATRRALERVRAEGYDDG